MIRKWIQKYKIWFRWVVFISSITLDIKGDISGQSVVDVLSEQTDIFSSKSEANRAVKGNALALNKEKVIQADHQFSTDDILAGGYLFVENGKKRKYLLRVI